MTQGTQGRVPGGGLGTRMLPATKVLPKEMLPVVDRPVIQYALEEAAAAGIEEFIFVTGRGKTIIEDHFDRAYELFETLARKGKTAELEALTGAVPQAGERGLHPPAGAHGPGPRGLVRAPPGRRRAVRGHAGRRPDPRAGAVPDADGRGARAHRRQHRGGDGGAGGADRPLRRDRRRARMDGRLVEVKGLVEKPKPAEAPSRLAVIGRYILLPRGVRASRRSSGWGAGGEIQLTDAMAKLIGDDAVPRAPLRGPALRLRRQAGLPRGDRRLGAGARRSCSARLRARSWRRYAEPDRSSVERSRPCASR